jgi:hypothetical protein
VIALTIRFRDDRGGFDLEDERGRVVDTITAAEIALAEHVPTLVSERVRAQQNVMRVRRFCERLRATEPDGYAVHLARAAGYIRSRGE